MTESTPRGPAPSLLRRLVASVRPKTIRSRLITLFTTLVFLQLLLSGLVVAKLVNRLLEEQIGSRALGLARAVALLPEVRAGLEGGDPEGRIQALAERLRIASGAEFVVVGDREGRRYSHPDPGKVGQTMVGGDNAPALQEGKSYVSRAVGTLGPSLRGKTPVRDASGAIIGVVSVGYLITDIRDLGRSYQVVILGAIVLLLLLGLAAAAGIAGIMRREILGYEPEEIAVLYQERIEMLRKVQESEERFRSLVESTSDLVWETDREGRYTYISPRVRELLGYQVHEVLGRRLEEFMPEEERKAAGVKLREALARGEAVRGLERRVRDSGGKGVFLETGAVPMRDQAGRVTGLRGVDRDIRERKAMEEHLLQASKVESIGQLAGGVAHDFNNILTSIFGSTDLALLSTPSDAPAHRFMRRVMDAAERGATLTRRLLAFARKQVIQPRLVDVGGLVLGMADLLKQLLGETVELVVRTDQALPPVKIDPNQLEQVLVNLTVNARDAMPGGGWLVVEVRRMTLREGTTTPPTDVEPGDYVVLTVGDTGTGMAEQVKRHVFEPFFTTKPVGRGTGLGLAMCYGIVKQNRGHITFSSEPGRGTTFWIYLPAEAGVAEGTGPAAPMETRRGGRETILVAEDDPGIREMIRETLGQLGYNVLMGSNGQEAMEIARRHTGPIHLLFTDVVMPRMGGKELADRLLAERRVERVVFASGYTEETIVHQGVLESGREFIQKPFTPLILSDRIRVVLDRLPMPTASPGEGI